MSVPGAPTGVIAYPSMSSAMVVWTAPASTGGSPITGYTVTSSSTSGSTSVTVGNVLNAFMTGIPNSSEVSFNVVAINANGSSPQSIASISVVITEELRVPICPTNVVAVVGAAEATISWTGSVFDGGSQITGYRVECIFRQYPDLYVGSDIRSVTYTGIIDCFQPIYFKVHAVNAIGNSSNIQFLNRSNPVNPGMSSPPTGVSAVAGNGSATVSWIAPQKVAGREETERPITGYTVTPSVGSPVTVGNVLSATLSNLTNGTPVTFTVKALNSSGPSVASSASAAVTPTGTTVPGAPTGVSAVAGTNSATVSWTAPAINGGSEITGYTVTPSVGSPVTVGNVLTTTLNLTSGTAVTFTVKATNSVGDSLASSASSSVTPTAPAATVPAAPTGVSAVAGTNSATVSWTAPSNGGSEITGYTVTPSVGAAVTVGNVLTTTLSNLTSGTALTFTVKATNSVGNSLDSSASSSVTPTAPAAGPPSSVLGVTGVAGIASATISWSAPLSNGGAAITGYKVICVPDNKKPNLAGPNDRSLVVTALKNAVLTTCTVVAINAAGQSDSVSFTPYPLPGPPKVTAVRGAAGVINLTWVAKPANAGSPITGYIVSLVSPAAPQSMVIPTPSVTATGGSVSVSGLTNGSSCIFSVRSVSSIGQSAGSLSKAVIAAGLPDAPTSVAGTRAVASAGLSWAAPTNTGGLPITGYIISYTLAGTLKTVAVKLVTSAIIKGLVNGTVYSFTIKAITLFGPSLPSAAAIVTPGTGL